MKSMKNEIKEYRRNNTVSANGLKGSNIFLKKKKKKKK